MDIIYAIDAKTWKHSWTVNKCTRLMIHHTGSVASLENMVDYLSEAKAEVSAHYAIVPNWDIARIGMDNYILWHAWRGDLLEWFKDNMNNYSIWIEVISNWTDFTKEQVNSLYKLVKELQKKHNISNENVIRHKDYTNRKWDIGDNFYKKVGCSSFEVWKEYGRSEHNIKSLRTQIMRLEEMNKEKDKKIKFYEWLLIRMKNILVKRK